MVFHKPGSFKGPGFYFKPLLIRFTKYKIPTLMDEFIRSDFYKHTFNLAADGYDNSALRFFQESAKHIPSLLELKGDEHILDIATGTGYAALALAERLSSGSVTGIDISDRMLERARQKRDARQLQNIQFIEMNMQDIKFPDEYFDLAINSFSLFFVRDMKKQLCHIADKVKINGTILMTTFGEKSFSGFSDLMMKQFQHYGIDIPELPSKHVSTVHGCTALFQTAGLREVKCIAINCGHYLNGASEWWDVVFNAGFRGLINQLSLYEMQKFRAEHLYEVSKFATEKGIWLDVPVLYTFGKQ
ncbi:methyltransferase domain-containing protein [candidate division KSB1 bacterium]|nr:methyltransferase domain-containing protein [candidate division KSB1 bacterium]